MAQQINLINPAFRSRKQPFAAVAMTQALAAVFAGGLALYGYAIYQAAMLKPAAIETDRQLVERRGQLAELSRAFSPQGSKLLEEEIARVESRIASRRAVLGDLTAGVSAVDGFAQYLSGLARQRVDGVWLTKVAVHASSGDVLLEGRALSAERVPAYLGQLRRETVFAGRIVAELKITAREVPAAARAALPPDAPAAFVEFTMNLPRSGAQASAAGARDSGSGKPL
jgi:MSHA biogenesis protein MshI